MRSFDTAAKTWDLNPEHNRRAEAAFDAISKKIVPTSFVMLTARKNNED
ncbi:MAG: hypothetical protein JW904_09370 [Spirochaetales bacterium]|nr:hypothetical protein [Spirochaetales bacterium]